MDFRLNDDEILSFIARGYHIFHPAIDADIHRAVCAQTRAAFVQGKNPGNAIYEQVPALAQALSHPQVVGALTSILGADYHMLCHRHAHLTQPGQAAGGFHQDGTPRALRGWTRPWRYGHRPRKVLLVYFPHAVPKELGPTTLVPGSQYYRQRPEAMEALERGVEGEAGVMAICHFSSWHRAGANTSDTERIMLKFVFDRRGEPREPSWQAAADYNPDFAADRAPMVGAPRRALVVPAQDLADDVELAWRPRGRTARRHGVAGIAIQRFSVGPRTRSPRGGL